MNTKVKQSEKQKQYKANRMALIELSKMIRQLIESGEYDSVNEGLKDIYEQSDPNIIEFRTFNQWKQDGATILKGSKAFLVWGQPRQVSQVPEGSTEPEEFKYWPLAYLFANTQVIFPEKSKPATRSSVPDHEPEECFSDVEIF